MTANLVAPDRSTRWQKLLRRLFPRATLPFLDTTPDFAPRYMSVYVVSVLGWLDRLRLLVSGRCEIQVRVFTDVDVGAAHSEACFSVMPPNPARGDRPLWTGCSMPVRKPS